MTWTSNIILRALAQQGGMTTIDLLVQATGMTVKQITNAADVLAGHGLLKRRGASTYTITEAGSSAIATDAEIKSGPKGPTGVKRNPSAFRKQLWQVIRMEKKGTIGDFLELILESNDDRDKAHTNAYKYILALLRAGYMAKLPLKRQEGGKSQQRYVLRIDSGPHAPIARKVAPELFDPNTGKAVPYAVKRGGA
jgi:predicted transcriptional regulator